MANAIHLFRRSVSVLALFVLTGCGGKTYAQEWVGKVKPVASSSFLATKDDPTYKRATKKLEKGLGEGNAVYSPASVVLTDFVYGGELDQYSSYANEALNAEQGHFRLESKSVVASTIGVEEQRRDNYVSHGIDVYVGDIPALEASLADHFGQEVRLNGNPGDYYLSKLTLDDRFPVPLNTRSLPFDGQGSFVYAHSIGQGRYADTESYSTVEINVGASSMAFFLPKEGKALKDIDTSLLFDTPWIEGRVEAFCPEFSIRSNHCDIEGSREIYQDCGFDFNRYGVHGEALTINGPTAAAPDFVFSLTLDRPFFFASYYRNLPLFVGQVTKL